ncbi:tmv resistance protein n [Fagus crenata]
MILRCPLLENYSIPFVAGDSDVILVFGNFTDDFRGRLSSPYVEGKPLLGRCIEDYKVRIDFICRSGMVEDRLDCPLVINISKKLPELRKLLSCSSSFGFRVIIPAGKLRDHLEECGFIGASITSNHPYLEIKMCAAGILYRQNLTEFLQVEGKIDKRSQCQVDKMENSKSNGQSDSHVGLERKLKSLLLRLYQCMLRSSVAYHEFFYQNLSHQVEEMVAGFDNRKDVGCSSSLQRIPFSPSFTGLLIAARKEQHASIMSSESLQFPPPKTRFNQKYPENQTQMPTRSTAPCSALPGSRRLPIPMLLPAASLPDLPRPCPARS